MGLILLLENLLQQEVVFQKNIRGYIPNKLIEPNAAIQDSISKPELLHIYTFLSQTENIFKV